MRNHKWFIIPILCLVFSIQGYEVSAAETLPLKIVLRGDPKATTILEQAIKNDPKITIPESKTDYSITVIKPDSATDYKIVEIIPDATVDYKITIIDPESKKDLGDLGRRLGEALREKLRMRQKESPNK